MTSNLDANTLAVLRNISALLNQALGDFNSLPSHIQDEINNEHNEENSLAHCLRWGTQATSEILDETNNPLDIVETTYKVGLWNQRTHNEDGRNVGPTDFEISVCDKRAQDSQLFVEVNGLDEDPDNTLAITVEISSLPETVKSVPCAHVHFDDNRVAFSLFKVGPHIFLRPETDTLIEDKLLLNNELCWMIS